MTPWSPPRPSIPTTESGLKRTVKEFTADYPFANSEAGRKFLEQMPIPPTDREKIAHGNAERLLGLSDNEG